MIQHMKTIRTELCELLGIKYPILQGGMAWISNAELASTVSNAGGLGIVSAMNSSAEWVRNEIRRTKEMTNQPFGVNVMLKSPHAEEVAQMLVEEKVPVITTGAGNPAKYMDAWLNAGIKVIPVIAACSMAKLSERVGAIALVAEGGESGGHIGELNTMPLVPQVCDAVSIPVIAAGGIGDGRGLAAALMLGAVGVQIGTRFLSAKECCISREYKERLLKAGDRDTIVTGRTLGHPVRSLKSPFSTTYAKMESDPAVSDEGLEAFGVGSLRMAVQEGNPQKGSFIAGEIAGLVQKEQSAREIIEEIIREAVECLEKASRYL